MAAALWMILVGLFAGVAETAESCSFDHQILTVPPDDYRALKRFFGVAANRRKTGAAWSEDNYGRMKGYLKFADGSLLEVWNQARWDKYGYQDACRIGRKELIEELAAIYGSKPGLFDKFRVVGRRDWIGDPRGGMFFIWAPSHQIRAGEPGIRQILKAVEPSVDGGVKMELIDDYRRGGLALEMLENRHVLTATDTGGVRRVAIATQEIGDNGLIAVRFTRKGSERESLKITATISVELTPGDGTLVLVPDLYKLDAKYLKDANHP